LDQKQIEHERREERGLKGTPTMSADLFISKCTDAVTIAKRIAAADPSERRAIAADAGWTQQDFEAEIAKRAAPSRRPGESLQQVWTAYATQNPDGIALWKASRAAPVGPAPKQAAQDLKYEPVGDASAELERMARQAAKSKNISFEQAYVALLTDPTRRELAQRVKAEELSATRMVRDQRWPNNQAEETSLTREWSRNRDI
jgi:hypothetical protein